MVLILGVVEHYRYLLTWWFSTYGHLHQNHQVRGGDASVGTKI